MIELLLEAMQHTHTAREGLAFLENVGGRLAVWAQGIIIPALTSNAHVSRCHQVGLDGGVSRWSVNPPKDCAVGLHVTLCDAKIQAKIWLELSKVRQILPKIVKVRKVFSLKSCYF